jgi:DNA-binding response OmpR family regulator
MATRTPEERVSQTARRMGTPQRTAGRADGADAPASFVDAEEPHMTVLVVEDDVVINEVLSELLTSEGHHVVAACNGQEGLEAFDRCNPTLVVSDVMMPKLDGREMVRQLRCRPGGRHVPIIVISAARALGQEEFGQDLFIEKPFDFDVFLDHVRALSTRGQAG